MRLENERLKATPGQGNGANGEGSLRREVMYIPRERKCPNFSGGPGTLSIEDWLEEIDCSTRGRHMSEIDKALFMYDHLEGEARAEIKFRPRGEREDPKFITDVLTELYSCSTSYVSLQHQFFDRRQKDSESLQEFSLALLSIMDKITKSNSDAVPNSDQVLRDQFAEGVRDHMLRRELKRLVRQTPEVSLLDLRKEAIRWVEEGQPQGVRHTRPTSHSYETQAIVTCEAVGAKQSEYSELKEIVMKQQEQLDMLIKTLGTQGGYNRGMQRPRQASRYKWSPEGQPICFRCNQAGHIARFCEKNTQSSQATVLSDRQQGEVTDQQKN